MFSRIPLFVVVLCVSLVGNCSANIKEYVQCNMCKTVPLEGNVDDCCCDFATVDNETKETFLPLLERIVQTRFFRYFKVNLWKDCPFFDDESLCFNSGCSVCECGPDEIPSTWLADEAETVDGDKDEECVEKQDECLESHDGLGGVDRGGAVVGTHVQGWTEDDDAFVWIEEDHNEEDMVYIDLLKNPEGFTGYGGSSARKVWMKMHEENCFLEAGMQDGSLCLEQRVFYRLISGLQSSISTHIALKFKSGDVWGANTDFFVDKVGRWPDRVENMYFLYLFLLRAVARAGDTLAMYDYRTGVEVEDVEISELMQRLLAARAPHSCDGGEEEEGAQCMHGFDESALYEIPDASTMSELEMHLFVQQKMELRSQLRQKFRVISTVMDCVGCEKCRLWSKMQILGIGTALKILFTPPGASLPPLQRNEVIALINSVAHIGESVAAVSQFREMEVDEAIDKLYMWGAVTVFGVLLVLGLCVRRCMGGGARKVKKRRSKMLEAAPEGEVGEPQQQVEGASSPTSLDSDDGGSSDAPIRRRRSKRVEQ